MTESLSRGRNVFRFLGVGIIGMSVLLFGVLLIFILRGQQLGAGVIADAILYIDIPGRIVVDTTLQANGPAAIPVAAGTHTVTFLDASPSVPPLTKKVAAGEFSYVHDPAPAWRAYVQPGQGTISASVFPPDAEVNILRCDPVSLYTLRDCSAQHLLTTAVFPGTYVVRFTHPLFEKHEERVTVNAGGTIYATHSFIRTVSTWEQWRKDYGHLLERDGYQGSRRYGAEDAFLLPFEAVGTVFGELFD